MQQTIGTLWAGPATATRLPPTPPLPSPSQTQTCEAASGPATPLLQILLAEPVPKISSRPRQYVIQGRTSSGQVFRPSDWAERLAGAMSCFRPDGGAGGIGSYIGYSPYCVPQLVGGLKCVQVSEALKGVEPMAWEFVMNFARDNQLQVEDLSADSAAASE